MTKKFVVFDVDGTLVDTMGGFEKAITRYSLENGMPVPCFDAIRQGYHYPDRFDFKWGVPLHEQGELLWTAASAAVEGEAAGDPEYMPHLFTGVKETLDMLKDDGHRLGVVTSKIEAPVLSTFVHYELIDHFCAIRTRDDIERRGEAEKPSPDQLLSIMRELGFDGVQTVMVGDSTMDMEMGRAAGAYAIGVTWGTHKRTALLDAGAHIVVDEEGFPGLVQAIKDCDDL